MVFPTIGLDQERNLDACVDYTLATTTGNREHDNHNFKESPNRSAWHRVKESPNRSAWHRVQRIAKSQCLAPSQRIAKSQCLAPSQSKGRYFNVVAASTSELPLDSACDIAL